MSVSVIISGRPLLQSTTQVVHDINRTLLYNKRETYVAYCTHFSDGK